MFETTADVVDARGMLTEALNADQRANDQENPNRHVEEFYMTVFEGIMQAGFAGRERYSLPEIWDHFVPSGREFLNSRKGRVNPFPFLQESAQAIETSHFKNLTAQILFAETLQELDLPKYIGLSLVKTIRATTKFRTLIPGVGVLRGEGDRVGEGRTYPRIGLIEETITTPELIKHGFIIEFTEEFLQEDRTGLALNRARRGTEIMADALEIELLNAVLGITSLYERNETGVQATYNDTHLGGDFDNVVSGNGLENWQSINNVLNAFDLITDPNNGKPVAITGNMKLVVPRALQQRALNITSAAQIQFGQRGAGDESVTVTSNPVNNNGGRGDSWEVVTNAYVRQVTGDSTTWFAGIFDRAFGYLEYWPIQVRELRPGSNDEWENDVVQGYKVRRLGSPFVRDPRYVMKNTA